MESDNVIRHKSFLFATRIVRMSKFLRARQEYTLSQQVLRSGTSIGAMVSEAQFAQSRADFINKMSIALKEANETLYWLRQLHVGEFIDERSFESMHKDCDELVAILVAIVKTSRKNSDT